MVNLFLNQIPKQIFRLSVLDKNTKWKNEPQVWIWVSYLNAWIRKLFCFSKFGNYSDTIAAWNLRTILQLSTGPGEKTTEPERVLVGTAHELSFYLLNISSKCVFLWIENQIPDSKTNNKISKFNQFFSFYDFW